MKLLDKVMGKFQKTNKVVVEIIAKEGCTPTYQTKQSAGADLRAILKNATSVVLKPGQRIKVQTGVKIALPAGYEAQVRPRSGLTLKGINADLGTIDSDYRGEICVILINNSRKKFVLEDRMRIAQLVISKYSEAEFINVEKFDYETERGEQGFGHTGIK